MGKVTRVTVVGHDPHNDDGARDYVRWYDLPFERFVEIRLHNPGHGGDLYYPGYFSCSYKTHIYKPGKHRPSRETTNEACEIAHLIKNSYEDKPHPALDFGYTEYTTLPQFMPDGSPSSDIMHRFRFSCLQRGPKGKIQILVTGQEWQLGEKVLEPKWEHSPVILPTKYLLKNVYEPIMRFCSCEYFLPH